MKRRNVVATMALLSGGVFFGLGFNKGLENIGHEAGIAVDHWGDKTYIEPSEVRAKGDELSRQTYLYFGAMAIGFATAAQQRLKQSNIEISEETRDLVGDLRRHSQATELAISGLAIANHLFALQLEQFPAVYPPIPELPAADDAIILPFISPRRQVPQHPDFEGVA